MEEQSAVVQAPAATTRCLAQKAFLGAVTTVTTAPPAWISTTWVWSSSVPPSFWNCCCEVARVRE